MDLRIAGYSFGTLKGIKTSRPARFGALRYRDFRLLWLGQLFSITGNQMQFTAMNCIWLPVIENDVLMFSVLGRQLELSAQALGLGVLGLVRILPVILFGLVGGVLADMHDRRKLIIWTQVAAALFTALLAALTLSGNVTVLLLYLLTSGVSGVAAFETPAQQSLLPQLVPREHFTNSVSLNQLLSQFGSIGGPALAGVLLASFNVGFVYVLNTLSFVAVLIALFLMRSQARPTRRGWGWRGRTLAWGRWWRGCGSCAARSLSGARCCWTFSRHSFRPLARCCRSSRETC